MLSKKRQVSIKKKREMAVRDAENIIYDMVLKADKKGKLVSYKEIEEKLTEPEYQLSKAPNPILTTNKDKNEHSKDQPQ